jgi:hypothetical protein
LRRARPDSATLRCLVISRPRCDRADFLKPSAFGVHQRGACAARSTPTRTMRSLPNYLNRIGLKHAAQPLKADLSTLALVMAAHSRAIAFENIDVVRGKTISMARDDVEKKLVDDLRGGYCWEQNTLLSMALEELGFDVVPLLCRVRWNKVAAQRGSPSDPGPQTPDP